MENIEELIDRAVANPMLNEVLRNVFKTLRADAQRLNGFRMVICEQDKALRERMGEAMETVFEAWGNTLTHETIVTPEAFNAMIDAVLLAACEARK